MSDIKYAMVIDQRRCIGCHTCAIACKSENNMPNGAEKVLLKVITENSTQTDLPVGTALTGGCTMDMFNMTDGTIPRLDFLTRSCQHCTDAPCVKVCPTGATFQRADGIVNQDTRICIGCMKCMQACPYETSTMRVYLGESVDFTTDMSGEMFPADSGTMSSAYGGAFTSGSQDIYPSRAQSVKKCTFCAQRVDEGEEPFCIGHCPARARYFGNINDTSSEVYQLLNSGRTVREAVFTTRDGFNKPKSSVYFLAATDKNL